MATWPATLPAPQRPGYEIEPADPSLRTGMEVGAARSRRITRARNDQVSVAWSLTDAQMAIFRDWFEGDAEAAGGSAWFAIVLPIGNTGATAQEARFIGAYRMAQQGADRWAVTARLEVRDV